MITIIDILGLVGDQTDSAVGQPLSGLWFGDIDALWRDSKQQAWCKSAIKAGRYSAPFLMTGLDKKMLHPANEPDVPVEFAVEANFLGSGSWKRSAA